MKKLALLLLLFSHSALAKDPIIRAMEYAAKINKVDVKIVEAICWVESKHNPKAFNKNDGGSPSYGLCQVKLASAQWMDKVYKLKNHATIERLKDPTINAFYAAKLLKFYLDQYDGDLAKAIRGYNLGHFDGVVNSDYHEKVQLAIKKFK